jgi:hypothetical protein
MTEALQPILALLDEGLRLYRRNFAGFVLLTASWFVPVAIVAGTTEAAESWVDERYRPFSAVLLFGGGVFLFFPLLIYLIGGLSRAAAAAAEGRAVRFREAMAIHPLRAAGMGCFTIVYAFVAQIVSSLVSMACICPLYFVGFMALAFVGAAANEGSIGALGLMAVGIFLLGFYTSLMIIGATGSGLFYSLQPWVQESASFGASLQRSMELIAFRFGRNLLVWCLAALLVAAAGLTVMATIGVLLPLPLLYALGEDSPATQAATLGAWLIGLMLVLPPLPIWMALLYQRNRAAYEGRDLVAKVDSWLRTQAVPDQSDDLRAESIPRTIIET